MIKCEKGKIEICGEWSVVLAEMTCIVRAVRKTLPLLEEQIEQVVDIGLSSDLDGLIEEEME